VSDLGSILVGLSVLAVIAVLALVIGLGFGRVVAAPAIRRVADRIEHDEESGDRPA
jgi:hypothetical protein